MARQYCRYCAHAVVTTQGSCWCEELKKEVSERTAVRADHLEQNAHRQGKERLQVFRVPGTRRLRPAPHLSPGAPTNRQRSNRSFFRGLTASFC